MESFQQLTTSTAQYAYLQPLEVLDEGVAVNDNGKDHREVDATIDGCIEGPALTPIKEELVSRDLRSYFLGKGKLFDEPESLPIIWLELPGRDDFAASKKKHRPKKSQTAQKPQLSAKKNVEREVACPSCDRKFVAVGHMKIHHARIHHSGRTMCRVCGRKFSHGGALCLHMRSHKLARPRK